MSLAVSLFGTDSRELAQRLQHLQSKDGYAELRLDRMAVDMDWPLLQQARGELKLILACVPSQEGGTYDGDFSGWLQCVQKAVAALKDRLLIDVPPCFADQAEAELGQNLPRIWSWHQPKPNPASTKPDLPQQYQALCQRANSTRGDVIKLVAWADCHEDALSVLPLYQLPGPRRVMFAQGPGSSASRLWALVMGAPWTYACWRDQATAPGQWAEHQVRRRPDWTSTPLFGVMGDPVQHSRSPLLWQAAFDWLGHNQKANEPAPDQAEGKARASWADGLYLPLQHRQLSPQTLKQAYADKRFQAFSVTAPLKQQALAAADRQSADATAIGAANLLLRDGEQWVAHNTDGVGALDPLQAAGLDDGAPVVIIGAGGAARAAAFEAARRGHRVIVAARRQQQAEQLCQHLQDQFTQQTAAPNSNSGQTPGDLIPRALDNPQLWQECEQAASFGVIQATPLGSVHKPGNPLTSCPPPAGGVVLDMVYDPARTEFLDSAEKAGCTVLPGHHMLLAQMLRQFELGCGQRPPETPLRLALESDLGMPSPPILLVGPRASGKSTLGRVLAETLQMEFVDADDELEQEQQRRISDWIPVDEPGFRQAEAELLTRLVQRQGTVVALGGGVVERPQSLELLAAQPRVFALELSQQEQIRRRQHDHRPALIKSNLPDEVRVLHKRRAELYLTACSGRRINVEGNLSSAFLRLLQSINLIG